LKSEFAYSGILDKQESHRIQCVIYDASGFSIAVNSTDGRQQKCRRIVDTSLNGRLENPTPPHYPFDRKILSGQIWTVLLALFDQIQSVLDLDDWNARQFIAVTLETPDESGNARGSGQALARRSSFVSDSAMKSPN